MPKKTNKKPPQSKTAFVKSFPATMPAKEISEKAKAAGLTISSGYVYEIRSSSRRKAGKKKSTNGKPGRPASMPTTNGAHNGQEAHFRRLVLDMGIARAKTELAAMERQLHAMIAGI